MPVMVSAGHAFPEMGQIIKTAHPFAGKDLEQS